VAQSDDGVHFELVSLTRTPSLNCSADGSALFIDPADGAGYIAYTAMDAPGQKDHVVAIDRLSPDLLSSSGQLVAMLPDYFVEGAMLFKRGARYYVVYGSCCCACRQGSGAVVLSATNLAGPWTRQSKDVNCRADAEVCAGFPSEQGEKERPTGQLIISAQGLGLSVLRQTAAARTVAVGARTRAGGAGGRSGGDDDDVTFLWQGERWLSGPNNPAGCTTLCQNATGVCAQSPDYNKAADLDYWIPLQFDADGTVLQFEDFVDDFNLTLPDNEDLRTLQPGAVLGSEDAEAAGASGVGR
jgi:hypothetical protein